LHSGQIYIGGGALRSQYGPTLTEECLLSRFLFLMVDQKGNGSILLRGEDNMYRDRVCANDQKMCPHNMTKVQVNNLFLYRGTKSLDYSGTYHLQIDHPWHDVLSPDHMVSQEKLVTVKS